MVPLRDSLDFTPEFVLAQAGASRRASNVAELLQADAAAELDDDAIALFLRVGFFAGDDTPFQAVRAALPARPNHLKPHSLTRPQLIEGFLDLLRAAVQRRLTTDDYVLPISGGRDSRHIFLELLAGGRPPRECVTVEHFPPRGNSDVSVAAQLCARCSVPHRVLPAATNQLAAEVEKNRRTSYCTDEHAQFLPLAQHLHATTRETYDGIAGDVLSQSMYLDAKLLDLFRSGRIAAAADLLLDGFGREGQEAALRWMLTDRANARFSRERAHERLLRELRQHADAPNPIASFFFWNRTRREIALAPFLLFAPVRVHAPFLDRELFEGLMATPAEMLLDRRLHTDAIAQRWPELADVPYARLENDSSRRNYFRTVAAGLGWRLSRSRSELLRVPSLVARCAATALDGGANRLWFLRIVTWLWQVERISTGNSAA